MKIKFSRKIIPFLIGLITVLSIIAITITILLDDQNELEEQDQVTQLSQEEFERASSFSSPSITQYNTKEECWLIYEGKVFDVTTILDQLFDVEENDCGTEIEELSADSTKKIAPYIVSSVSN
ncbi:hypothetical protein GF389_04005 [Candidatus Dojkabacteria bacterium]|nr:hypothetical protein [Candidatus Dojkabacteria bacterium]